MEKDEIALMSNFTFFHNVFYGISILKSFNSHISVVVVCSFFEIRTVSKWCIREWIQTFSMDPLVCLFMQPICRSIDGWTDGWMDGWVDGLIDESMDGWMDGWMDESMDGSMEKVTFGKSGCKGHHPTLRKVRKISK